MDDGRRSRRNFLTAIAFVTACSNAQTDPAPREPHDGRLAHPGGAGGRMDFAPPKDAPDEHWCEADSVPETKAGAGQCYRTADECARMSEHLWKQYGNAGAVPGCTKRSKVHCFDMVSRGTPYEVCRSTPAGCAEHHRVQTGDAWVDRITDGCQAR